MGHAQKWNKSYSQLSKDHGVTTSALKYWSKQGYDLNDEAVLKSLVSGAKNKTASVNQSASLRKLTLSDSLGLSGSLERLRQAELELSKAYVDALSKGNGDAFTIRKEWLDVCEQLRKAEKDSPDVLEANKKTVTIDEVETVLIKCFSRLRGSLESLPARVTKELPQELGVKVLNSIREEINLYIEELESCQFLKGFNEG